MAEKELEDLPPGYSNLGYDNESEAGPSAPTIQVSPSGADYNNSEALSSAPIIQVSPSGADYNKSEAVPSAPIIQVSPSGADFLHEPPHPTAPPVYVSLGEPPLVYKPPDLVFEDIYDACVNYVKKHCCYGSRFIKRMKLTEITNRAVYHYKLESFGERRESAFGVDPYRGGEYDGPENGPAPDPWAIPATAPYLFIDCGVKKEIPHTTTIHICDRCDGIGKVRCSWCSGSGSNSCWRCSGRGRDSDNNSCSSCHGSGREQCSRCWGSGRVTCTRCDGYGKIKKYKVLIVTWKNHILNFVTNTDNMPAELILKTGAVTIFEKTDTALQPIQNAADETVNAASVNFLESHLRSFPSEMIIRQRHVLRATPVTRVKYQWKEKEGEFYVYGTGREVYFEVYPQTCCCCTCC